jgi:hypothetical protein
VTVNPSSSHLHGLAFVFNRVFSCVIDLFPPPVVLAYLSGWCKFHNTTDYTANWLKIKVALVPPKPKEFERATPTLASLATLGT